MGILNITPDSFFPGSRVQELDAILARASTLITEGADIIDIGGQTTRPGSDRISADEELQRILPAVEALATNFPSAFISIDTYYSSVAKAAINAGACIVNDISAGSMDAKMITTVSSLSVPYVLMHMKGTPKSMQDNAKYENVTIEVLDFFSYKIDELKTAGIHDVLIDPGFGFGKTIDHNFQLLKELNVFKILERPILVGVSRKSTIYKTLDVPIDDALNGTTVLHTIALMNGATILRVHDVKEAKEAINLYRKISE